MKIRLAILTGLCAAVVSTMSMTAVAEANCQYNNRSYSTGGTVCECPTVSGQKVGKHFRDGLIVSRRLRCSGAAWEVAEESCITLKFGNSNDFTATLNRLSQDLCPAATGSDGKL